MQLKKISFWSLLLIAVVALWLFSMRVVLRPGPEPVSQSDAIPQAISFVQQQLINSLGLIETYPYRVKAIADRPGYTPESLSESLGLWLGILEKAGQRKKFASQVSVLQHYFKLQNNTLSWRLTLGQERETVYPAPSSATIDDLRVVRALLAAAQKWGISEYRHLAMQLAQGLKRNALWEDLLMHQASLDRQDPGTHIVDLSYLDLQTMAQLGAADSQWQKATEKCSHVLKEGMRPTGLFYDKYDADKKSHFPSEKNLINSLLCAIHLAERSYNVDSTCNFLKREWQQRKKLYGRYDPDTGESIVSYESVAVYALAMHLAILKGDRTFAQQMRARILFLSTRPKTEPWQGSMVPEGGHCFDHLQALLSFLLYEQRTGSYPS